MSSIRRRDLPDHIGDFDTELLTTLCEDAGWNAGDLAFQVTEDYDDVKQHLEDLDIKGDPTPICEEPAVSLWRGDPEDFGLGGEQA